MSETFPSKIAGTSHKNDDGTDRQELIRKHCRKGSELILIREPDNPYSDDAIGIWIRSGDFFKQNYQIGYVTSYAARDLAYYMDRGGKVKAIIKEITGGTRSKPSLGINIQITKLD